MAQVLHLDAGELRQRLSKRLRCKAVGELDGQLVHSPGPVPLEDVDTDEVAPELADPGGDLAERPGTVCEPQSYDYVAEHGFTVRVACERTISAARTAGELAGRDEAAAGGWRAAAHRPALIPEPSQAVDDTPRPRVIALRSAPVGHRYAKRPRPSFVQEWEPEYTRHRIVQEEEPC